MLFACALRDNGMTSSWLETTSFICFRPVCILCFNVIRICFQLQSISHWIQYNISANQIHSKCWICYCSNRRASSALTKEELNRNSVVNNSYGDPKPELHRNLDVSAMTINTTTVLDETASPSEEERYVLVQCSVSLIIIINGTT
mgnify:CR=1 FL=1